MSTINLQSSATLAAISSEKGFVTVGSLGKSGELQCRVSRGVIACQQVSGGRSVPVRVVSVNPRASTVSLDTSSGAVTLTVRGDLAGLEPHPWDG